MTRHEYENLCTAVDSGVERFVVNRETGETGQVLACRRDELEVDVYGRQELWTKESCTEREMTQMETPSGPQGLYRPQR